VSKGRCYGVTHRHRQRDSNIRRSQGENRGARSGERRSKTEVAILKDDLREAQVANKTLLDEINRIREHPSNAKLEKTLAFLKSFEHSAKA